MDTEYCLICAEECNDFKRSPVACPYCSFTACRACCQHYILDQQASICMNNSCKKEWTRKFVVNSFPNAWVEKAWKKMNSDVGVEREKALMPATMTLVEERKAKNTMQSEVDSIKQELGLLQRRKWALEIQLRQGGDVITTKSVSNGRKCPDTECRGYLSTQWKCGLCEKWACHECHIIKGDTRDAEHTCGP